MNTNSFIDPTTVPVYSVELLNTKINLQLQTQFNIVYVEGEVSNLAKPASGHCYFTLKDDKSQIRCAFFQTDRRTQSLQNLSYLKNGQKIIVRAKLSIYIPRGDYQLIVDNIFPTGLGELQIAFEQLKQKLLKEGLFDPQYKKSIPQVPNIIWVVTSKTGAAIRDILITLKKKLPTITINIIPTLVQGEMAPNSIINALNFVDSQSNPKTDVVLLARGGGSLEDLWAFNNEQLARTIFTLKTPIITGIGHETDSTIADFVADLRAATPTAAALAACLDSSDYQKNMDKLQKYIFKLYNNYINNIAEKLKYLKLRLSQLHPQDTILIQLQQTDELHLKLSKSINQVLRSYQQHIDILRYKLQSTNPLNILSVQENNLKHCINSLNYLIKNILIHHKNSLTQAVKKLNCINPLEVLARGYSILQNAQGKIITDSNCVSAEEIIIAKLSIGSLQCKVVQTNNN